MPAYQGGEAPFGDDPYGIGAGAPYTGGGLPPDQRGVPPGPSYGSAAPGGDSGGGDSGQGSGKAKVPSMEDILGADPFYNQTLALLKAMGADDAALAQYKMSRMQQYYGSASDPLSILGRLKQTYDDRGRYIVNSLAGRGMIFSGETGWQNQRNALAYQQSQYDANFKLQDYIDGIKEALAQADRQRQMSQLQAEADAVSRFLADNLQSGT